MAVEAEYPEKDRRHFRRINRSFIARVSPHGREEWRLVFIRNISKGGVLISGDKEFKSGILIDLSIKILPKHETVECTGEITRCHATVEFQIYESAVRFTKISHEDNELIEKSTEEYLRKLKNSGVKLE